jgi:transposase
LACGILLSMQTPLFVRPLTADERATLETGLRFPSAFTVRRCQILLASAEGKSTTMIARQLRSTDQTVRNTIHAFHRRGLAVLQPQSSRPHTTFALFDAGTCEALRALLHQSPRTFGKPTSRWTLALAAEVSFAQGLTPRLVSDETIRQALHRLGVAWKRAKHWITSPDPAYLRKKTTVERRSFPLRVPQCVRSDAEKGASTAKAQAKPQKPSTAKRRPGRPRGRQNQPQADVTLTPERGRIAGTLDALMTLVAGYLPLTDLVLDGHFGHHNILQMARQGHWHLISKRRCDAALYCPYTGP